MKANVAQIHFGLGFLLVFGTDVDIKFLQLGDGFFLFRGDQMVGLQANDARDALLSDPDRLSKEHTAVDPAYGAEF